MTQNSVIKTIGNYEIVVGDYSDLPDWLSPEILLLLVPISFAVPFLLAGDTAPVETVMAAVFGACSAASLLWIAVVLLSEGVLGISVRKYHIEIRQKGEKTVINSIWVTATGNKIADRYSICSAVAISEPIARKLLEEDEALRHIALPCDQSNTE